MYYELNALFTSFMNIKEKVGNKEFNFGRNLYLGTIELPNNPIYYILLNNTKHKFKIILENKESISFNNKVFISTIKPTKAYILSINIQTTAQFTTLKNSTNVQNIIEDEVELVEINQNNLDKYFKLSTHLNTNEKYSEYLYQVTLDTDLLKKLQVISTDLDVTLIIDIEKQYKLRDTVINDNVLYTNHIVHVLEIINRIQDYVPTRLIMSLKSQRLRYKDTLINVAFEYASHNYEQMPDKVKFNKLIVELQNLLHSK